MARSQRLRNDRQPTSEDNRFAVYAQSCDWHRTTVSPGPPVRLAGPPVPSLESFPRWDAAKLRAHRPQSGACDHPAMACLLAARHFCTLLRPDGGRAKALLLAPVRSPAGPG